MNESTQHTYSSFLAYEYKEQKQLVVGEVEKWKNRVCTWDGEGAKRKVI